MDQREKQAFDHLLENIVRDDSLYQRYVPSGVSGMPDRKSGKKKLTVLGLQCVSSNHPIDDWPELWHVTKDEAHTIRAYFHNTPILTQIEELYAAHPNVFEGESRAHLESHRLDVARGGLRIPLFDYLSED